MNNLFIDGSMDDSLFLDDIPDLLSDGEEDISSTSSNCGCDVRSMGKRYAYNVTDDIFPVSRGAALNTEGTEREVQAGQPVTTTIGFKNIDPITYEISRTEAQRENTEPTHCVGRGADCGDWLLMPTDIAPYSANEDEYHFGDDDQAEHLSKMIGNRIRAELSTKSINSRIIEGRLTAVNENFLMIEQPDTGASIAYDMNIFKYFMFLPEAMAQDTNARTNLNANSGIRRQHNSKNKFSNNTLKQYSSTPF